MSAKPQVDKYFAALDRLVKRGAPISNDAVAMEAGSGKGSIKSSRPLYAELIAAIDEAARKQKEARAAADPLPGLRLQVADLTRTVDQLLERELCLLDENRKLREEVRQLKLGRPFVVPDKPLRR